MQNHKYKGLTKSYIQMFTCAGCQVPLTPMLFRHVCSVFQSCLTLCDPMDCGLPGAGHGFPRQEYWSRLSFPFSRGSSPPRDWTHHFCVYCIGRWILYHLANWKAHVVQGSAVNWIATPVKISITNIHKWKSPKIPEKLQETPKAKAKGFILPDFKT